MKNNFKFYLLIWAILIIVWCSVVFLIRPILPGYVIKYDKRFWISFLFIFATFIGNLVCAYYIFKSENSKKLFLNMSLLIVNRVALITMVIVGSVLMLIPDFPFWKTAILCIVIFAFNLVIVVNTLWSSNLVNIADEKIKNKTSFIKNITVEVENIMGSTKNEALKIECKKLYDAIRYSDPMSNESLIEIENNITNLIKELYRAVNNNDIEKLKKIVDEIVILVNSRNKRCRLYK